MKGVERAAMWNLKMNNLLARAAALGASDLHLSCGHSPFFRVDGGLSADDSLPPLNEESLMALLSEILCPEQGARLKREKDLDCAFEADEPSLSFRLRLNCYWALGLPHAAIRLIPMKIPSLGELGLPEALRSFCARKKGLFLAAGPSGSGKSTTLAALVQEINRTRRVHVVTLEDPVEFVYRSERSLIHQREIGQDCASFPEGLRRALRQDPDVILIGEMRDPETIAAAVTAAETGHLVLATLHTQDAPQTLDRIIDAFPPNQQPQVRNQLSSSLLGVCSQQLVPAAGGGRTVAVELLTATSAVRNAIHEGKTFQLRSLIQTGAAEGMRSMEQSLAWLVRRGRISEETAMDCAFDAAELQRLLRALQGAQ